MVSIDKYKNLSDCGSTDCCRLDQLKHSVVIFVKNVAKHDVTAQQNVVFVDAKKSEIQPRFKITASVC